MNESVILSNLVGEGILSAVDFGTVEFESWRGTESANTIAFTLDGRTYVAQEDPDDGYRSAMGSLSVSDAVLKNQFTPATVVGQMREAGQYEHGCDVLQLVDASTGKVVLEVGTENCADWYPGFVARWTPENLVHNNPDFFRDSKGNL